MSRFSGYIVLVLWCLVMGWIGVTFSYAPTIYPKRSFGLFEKIAADGWIEDSASINLPELLARGNRVSIEFIGWRPAGLPPAHIRVSLCGRAISEFLIKKPEVRDFYLTGECEPRQLKFHVLNPFQPSANDTRQLGTQISKVSIHSRLGVPLVRPWVTIVAAFFLMIPTVLFYLALRNFPLTQGLSVVLVPVVLVSCMTTTTYLQFYKLTGIWTMLSCLAVAVMVAQGYVRHRFLEDTRSLVDAFGPAILVVAVVIGAYLRFSGLSFGLPLEYHSDESAKVNAIMRMVANHDLNPRYFLHPSLLLYSTYGLNSILHAIGVFDGDFRSSAFLSGRLVSAASGTLSIVLTYWIGRRLCSAGVGAVAAAILAFSPLHTTSSRYLKEDALLVFVILIVCVVVVEAVAHRKPRWLLLAGFMAGVSTSVKYSGLLSLCIVFAAPWLASRRILPDRGFLGWAVLGICLAPLGFVFCTPYSILDPKTFLHDFQFERSHMERGHSAAIDPWSQYWSYHLIRSIFPGMTVLPTCLALVGAGIALWYRRVEGLFLVALVLLFYLPAEYVRAKPAPQPERYIFPCLPFLAIFTGMAIDAILRSRVPKVVGALVLLAALVVPLYRSVSLARDLEPDSRERMAQWVDQNLPIGSVLYIDSPYYDATPSRDDLQVQYAPPELVHRDLRAERLQGQGVDFLLLSSLWYDRYFSQPRADEGVREQVRALFRTLPVVHEEWAASGTYGFHNPRITLFAVGQDRPLPLLIMEGNMGRTSFNSWYDRFRVFFS